MGKRTASQWQRWVNQAHPVMVLISGPSGVGKDAVLRRMRALSYPFCFVVTVTDRSPRENEVHGQDYFFISPERFDAMQANGELLEASLVYKERKGVPRAQVVEGLASGKDVLMRLDVQGAAKFRLVVPKLISVFVTAASEAELVARLRGRQTEGGKTLEERLAVAQAEMERIDEFHYVVVNRQGQLDETVAQIVAIMTAEKCRVGWSKARLSS